MKLEDVAKLDPMQRLVYWIKERHQIYLRRKAGKPKPWTDDEVLQRYFFTNPYRENDKTTIWFRENVREPLRNDPRVLFATICFRWFNLISTGEALKEYYPDDYQFGLLENWDVRKCVRCLSYLRAQKVSVFTGAFMIPAVPGTNKIEHVAKQVNNVWKDRENLLSFFHDNIERLGRSHSLRLQDAHAKLIEYPWLGNFMAYEVVTDLRHTYLLEDAPDKLTWANPGPGCIRGLRRLAGEPLSSKGNSDCMPKPKDWQERMQKLLQYVQKRLPLMPSFEMREIEHSLCEWDKYERARLNDGRMKRTYKGY